VAEIAVDPDGMRARAAALRALSGSVDAADVPHRAPDCGDPLATAAVAALLGVVRDALPAVAVELTTVSTIVARAASLYEHTDAAVAGD
jgi:hypothetical protein